MAGLRSLRGLLVAVLAVALLGGLVLWRALDDEPYRATPGRGGGSVPAGAAATTLGRLATALETGDRDAAVAVAADAPGSAGLLGALAGNARRLDVDDVELRYLSESTGLDESGAWTAVVEVGWRFAGFDRRPAETEVAVTFADSGRTVAGVGGDPGRTPVWLTGPVQVRRTTTSLVLAAGTAREVGRRLDRWAAQARTATAEVGSVLGGDPRLVVEVPRTAADLDEALDVDPGTYASIAAVTAPVDGSTGAAAPVHILLNPTLYGDLDDVAAQVVMTHEAVHVVTDAPDRTDEPLWLIEGFADYVALRDVDLPTSTTAGQVIDQVRRRGVPDALPGDGAFGTRETHLGASYEAAWLACVVLAERGGQEALVELYDRADDPGGLDRGLRELFTWSEADLLGAWQQRLREVAA